MTVRLRLAATLGALTLATGAGCAAPAPVTAPAATGTAATGTTVSTPPARTPTPDLGTAARAGRSPTTSSAHAVTHAKPAACTVSSRTWKGHRRFWTRDTTCYSSPWFAGRHRIMIGFGCTTSPWYPTAPACPHRGGIHHGIDIDMPVGTAVRSAVTGTAVVRPSTMGPAYGRNGLIIRSGGRDYVLGHLSRLTVRNGQRVRAGQLIARSGQSGVEDEDGPHLHVELRPAGRGYTAAVSPRRALRLTAHR